MITIGILLNITSPFSRRIVESFLRPDFRVVVIYLSSRSRSYIKKQKNQIKKFSELISNYHGKVIDISLPNLSHLDYFLAGKKLKKITKEHKLDAIFSLYGGGFALSTYLSKFRPYFLYLLGSDVLRTNYLTAGIGKKTYSAAEKIFVNGKYLLKTAREKFGLKNCQLVYIGVNTQKFRPTKKFPDKINLISTRGFLPVYNNEYIIRALSHLKKSKNINKIIFAADGSNLNRAKKLAGEILLEDIHQKVKFLGGIDQNEMVKCLQDSSVFVSVSKSDGQAISLMEAMACGVFPILSDIPANREWIKPKWKNGIIVPLGQPEKLAAVIEIAVSDEKLRRNAAKINRKIAIDHFDSKKNLDVVVEEIRIIIKKTKTDL